MGDLSDCYFFKVLPSEISLVRVFVENLVGLCRIAYQRRL